MRIADSRTTSNMVGMKVGVLIIIAASMFMGAESIAAAVSSPVLARVELTGSADQLGVPVYAVLQDAVGQTYALVSAPETELRKGGQAFQILRPEGHLSEYVIASAMREEARAKVRGQFDILFDDGRQMVVRASDADVGQLAEWGFELVRLSDDPMIFDPTPRGAWADFLNGGSFTYDPLVAEMIGQVKRTNLYAQMEWITGEKPALVGGGLYSISNRVTSRGQPVQKAVSYMAEQFKAMGLHVTCQGWSSGTNVIAEQTGTTLSNEIVLVVAHLDNMPDGNRAPGADDNASGSIGVLTAARIMAKYKFERTVRFVLFTGEEQGLLGSQAYADMVYARGDNIVGVFNMDMISWQSANGPVPELHTRYTSDPGYSNDYAIVAMFTNVMSAYGLSGLLAPIVSADYNPQSDHYRFWGKGYPAILAIEGYPSQNPYYHKTSDALQNINLTFYCDYVQAAIGTVAHLARPVGRVDLDVIEIANGNWIYGSGIGIGTLYLRHLAGAQESVDIFDVAGSNAPANPNANWLRIHTAPYSTLLATDARPTNSASYYLRLALGGFYERADLFIDQPPAIRFSGLAAQQPRLSCACACG